MNKKIIYFILILLISDLNLLFSQSHPFPQHVKYYNGVIIPGNFSQKQLDDNTSAFYDKWKKEYIKFDKCTSSLYVYHQEKHYENECVSEGQGYGMVIVAYMAGYDTSAKEIYDSLYKYYKLHRSNYKSGMNQKYKYLMSGYQMKKCNKQSSDAATDGDLDIAYSLLLAHAQWGSGGKINYFKEASLIDSAILLQEINNKTFIVLKGNAIEPPDPKSKNDTGSPDYNDMRTSDFMPAHFRVFMHAFKDEKWKKIIDSCYKLFNTVQTKFSSVGLVPDFIQNVMYPRPAYAGYEETDDNNYAHNACRVPWRIATDFILYGDTLSRKFVTKINKWITGSTKLDIHNISEGYMLNGAPISSNTSHFPVMSFVCPFAVSAMVDSANQQWLNNLYKYIVAFEIKLPTGLKDEGQYDYYNNSIKMFTLIILSKNYWAPE